MATFAQIYKQELKGKGVLSSLGSAALKSTAERFDPRNILFGGTGILSSTGQKIFGKGFDPLKRAPSISRVTSESSTLTSEVLGQLLSSSQQQESKLDIIGKNTMPLRAMARDMNVMRQNIIKLVKLQGGEATNRADAFFRRSSEEETAYENKLGQKTESRAPTPVAQKTESGGGLFSGLLSAIGGIGPVVGAAITPLVTALKPLQDLSKNGLNIGLKFAGKALGSLIPLTGSVIKQFIKSAVPFLAANPALLSIGALAWVMNELYSSDTATEARTIDELLKIPEAQRTPEQKRLLKELIDKAKKRNEAATTSYESSSEFSPMTGPMPTLDTSGRRTAAEDPRSTTYRPSGTQDTAPTKITPSDTKRTMSEDLVNFVKEREGFSAKAFWDEKQYSIGYGTRANSKDEVITEAEADKRLRDELWKTQNIVLRKMAKYDLTQGQLDALTSFTYNLGAGGLNQLTGNYTRSLEEIATKIPEYNKVGRVTDKRTGLKKYEEVPGLTIRRAKELEMFRTSMNNLGTTLSTTTNANRDLQNSSSQTSAPSITIQNNSSVKNDTNIVPDKASVLDRNMFDLYYRKVM